MSIDAQANLVDLPYSPRLLSFAATVSSGFTFALCPNAIDVNLRAPNGVELEFSLVQPTLRRLRLNYYPTENISRSLGNFSRLEHFECLACVLPEDGFLRTNSDSLLSAAITVSAPSGRSNALEIEAANLRDLRVEHFQILNLTTPELRTLDADNLDSISAGLTSALLLESLFVKMVPPFDSTELSIFPNLKNLVFGQLSDEQLHNFTQLLCHMVEFNPLLEEVQFSSEANSSLLFEFPPCIRRLSFFSSLKYSGVALNSTSLFDNTPRSLKQLTLRGMLNPMATFDAFFAFPRLQSVLFMTDSPNATFVGELPPDFFVRLSSLTKFHMTSPGLVGTIPWYGWENMQSVYLRGNFESWPTFLGKASQLQYLLLESPLLSTIPTDDVLHAAEMSSLEQLVFVGSGRSGQLRGPVPAFWTHLPRLRTAYFINCGFEGTIPSPIAAPMLMMLRLDFNLLCGPLPELTLKMSPRQLHLDHNRLSGTIPTSWSTHLRILDRASLSHNVLSGTVPGLPFRDTSIILLNDNYFSALQWNFSSARGPNTINLSNNPIDLCLQDPQANSTPPTNCSFNNVLQCPSGTCTSFWDFCTTFVCTGNYSANPPAAQCVIPPPRVPPPIYSTTCPPPPPGFICRDNQWIAPGPISTPSITFPPNIGTVTVGGNLSVPGSVIFSGTGTTLEVNGCLQMLPTEIVIQPSGNEESNPITLITQKGANCETDLRLVPVRIDQKKTCEKTSVSTASSTPSALVVVFTIDKRGCSIKWIILGCTLVAVALIIVVTSILIWKYRINQALLKTKLKK